MATAPSALQPQNPVDVEAMRKDGHSDEEIIQHLSKLRNFNYRKAMSDGYTKEQVMSHLSGIAPAPSNTLVVPSAPPSAPPAPSPNTLPEAKNRFGQNVGDPSDYGKDDVIDWLRPIVGHFAGVTAGAAAAGGTAPVTLPTTGGLGMVPAYAAGHVAGYTAADIAMQYAKDKKPKDMEEALREAAKSGVITEVMNAAIPSMVRGVGNAYKEYTKPGTIVNKTMVGLQATFSQLYDDAFGKRSFIPKWLEDVWASGAKNTAMNRSAQIGTKMANEMEGTVQSNFDPAVSFTKTQKNLVEATKQSKAYSNAQGDTAVAISENFPVTRQVVTAKPQPLGLPGKPIVGPDGQPIMGPPTVANITVSGPIETHNGTAAAQKVITDMDDVINSTSLPAQAKLLDPHQSELRKLAQKIVDSTVDEDGNQIPISFRDAWTLKKMADEFHTYERVNASKGEVNSTSNFFKSISEALNDDMDHGFDNWPVSRTDHDLAQRQLVAKAAAQDAWNTAKKTVGQRLALLDAEGSKLKNVIEAGTTDLPAMERILNDHQELSKALNAGEMVFPGGGGRVYTSTRQDFKNYKLQRMFDDAWTTNPERPTEKSFSSTKLMNAWNDADFKASKEILWSPSQRNEYDKLFNALAATQGKQMVSNARIRAWHGGVAVASGLSAGFLKGSIGTGVLSGLGVGSIGVGQAVISRLMVNPNVARAFVAGISGAPLGMSAEAFSRHFAKAAAGETISLIDGAGKEQKAKIDLDGNILPTQ